MNRIKEFNNTLINSPRNMIDEVLKFGHDNVYFIFLMVLGVLDSGCIIGSRSVVTKYPICFNHSGSSVEEKMM